MSRAGNRLETWIVWGIWGAMVLVAYGCVLRFARDVPLAEDWLLVRPLTGHEPDRLRWLWEQSNEHRIPLPKTLLLTLLLATGGDFRSGMVLNVAVVAATAALMIVVARHIRGGRTRLTDGFFPLLLLHLGHWENLLWSWQLTQVLPSMLACALLLSLARFPDLATAAGASAAGASLLLLPLCGANGLVFVPVIAAWLAYRGVVEVRKGAQSGRRASSGIALIAIAVAAFGLCAAYFVGYARPGWLPPNSGPATSVAVAVQFLSFGLGPAVRNGWGPAAAVAVGFLLVGTLAAIRGVRHNGGAERDRAIGLLLFIANIVGFVLVMGRGRAAALDVYGNWPLRYALMAAPAFCAVYLVCELFATPRVRRAVQLGLFGISALLLPFNGWEAQAWAKAYLDGARALERDIAAGKSPDFIARRHAEFLIHWWDADTLVDRMMMLRERGIGVFARLQLGAPEGTPLEAGVADVTADARAIGSESTAGVTVGDREAVVVQTFAYDFPEASEVWLAWGVGDWQPVAEALRPAGTTITKRVMRSPMRKDGAIFRADVRVPGP